MDKEKFNKFIIIFLLIEPLIDVLTSFQVRNNIGLFSIGTIIRGLFFLFIIIYLYKNNYSRKSILLFLLYVFLAMIYYLSDSKINIFSEIINIIKIFYLPFIICFFNNYENEKINDKFTLGIYLIYLNLILIPYLFNVGYNISDVYVNKKGYLGLFYSGNEISAVILSLMPVAVNYIYNSKNYILKVFVLLETLFSVMLIGTKTLFLGFIVIVLYFIIKYIKNNFILLSTKMKLIFVSIFILCISILVLVTPRLSVTKNLNVSLNYYKIEKLDDLFTYESIDNIMFSKRLTYLNKINSEYKKGDLKSYIYGIGNTKIMNIKDIEIDIFDIFYSIGIFGTFIYLLILIVSINKVKLKGYYKLSLILILIASLFSGHILTEPMVTIYIGLLYILNKNKKEDNKKKILLVSNMYPSEKYKFYGSFVRNTKILLEENGFIVDKVVKYKETKFLNKLFSYIMFYIKTTIKGIVNNYDYIYVHYISHSSFGAIIPKVTSKNTKLVLNAHGNDVVADFDFEKKNEKKSKKFLKFADNVVVPSNYYKKVMIDKYGVSENIITVYPSGGVDTEKFRKKDKNESKKISNLKEEYSYIGYISRIEKNKGYDVFLKAIKNLEEEGKIGNKKFLIIGTGSEEDKMYKLIKELDILKYLEIRNMVSQDELVDIYNSLDLFIFPTYRESESLGLVGLEAMACETFLIASKNYGPTDYVINKKNGLFFEPKDDIDLKNKILEYENLNQEQYKKIIKKARQTAIKYDFKNTAHLILDVFKRGNE